MEMTLFPTEPGTNPKTPKGHRAKVTKLSDPRCGNCLRRFHADFGKAIYCSVRHSNLTINGQLKVRRMQPPCNHYKPQVTP